MKLNECDVLAIRRSDEPLSVLAKRYGVARSQISRIQTGVGWSRVGGPIREANTDFGRKLSDDAVRDIRTSSDQKTALARRYGVNRATIYAVINRQRYAHVAPKAA